jgi:hypothetical protein
LLDPSLKGIEVLVSPDSNPQPPGAPLPPSAPRNEEAIRMREILASQEGKARYALRKSTVEPVFGQIKEARGIRRFRLRGLFKVASVPETAFPLTHLSISYHEFDNLLSDTLRN